MTTGTPEDLVVRAGPAANGGSCVARHEARVVFEAMLAARNHLGLLSEDTHPVTGEMWGNFPQTYSMVGLINCAMRLSKPWNSVV